MAKETLTITDNRNGKQYEIPIENETIRASDLRQIKVSSDDFGLMSYDPAFTNTASCKSRITYIDGDKGILRYRGCPIAITSRCGSTTSKCTRWCTKTSRSSWKVSATTRIRWGCCWARLARCPP